MDVLDTNVNFTIDGANPYGVQQNKCIDCGNCVSGCNIGAKNTLYMNYLPMAVAAGVTVHSQTTHKLHVLTQFDIHDSHSRRATSSGAVFGGYRAKIL